MRLSPALRGALPLLAVTFTSRVASLALSLLPAMLVEREAGPLAAALTMGVVRAASVVGSLGGAAADRWGLRPTLVAALVVSGLGALGMLVRGPLLLLVLAAVVAQVGAGVFPTLARLLLVQLVPFEAQREALAWHRAVTNLGLVVSFGLGAALGTSVGTLLALDALSSFVAAALAARVPDAGDADGRPQASATPGATPLLFTWVTLIVGAWGLTYEAYLTATAAQLRKTLGPEGVQVYSAVMLANTVGCAAFGVLAARAIAEPRWSVPAGALLLAVGAAIGVTWPGSVPAAAVGIVVVTVGELVYTATAPFVWMALLPASQRRATVFAAATTAVSLLRAAGAALAFPLIVEARSPGLGMALLALPLVLLTLAAEPAWQVVRRPRP